jgi:hypothetical protein
MCDKHPESRKKEVYRGEERQLHATLVNSIGDIVNDQWRVCIFGISEVARGNAEVMTHELPSAKTDEYCRERASATLCRLNRRLCYFAKVYKK